LHNKELLTIYLVNNKEKQKLIKENFNLLSLSIIVNKNNKQASLNIILNKNVKSNNKEECFRYCEIINKTNKFKDFERSLLLKDKVV